MCSRLERALQTLSSPKASLALKKDAALRLTDILTHHSENSEDILKHLTSNLLESKDNNTRICSASVLKQFSVRIVSLVMLTLEDLQMDCCEGSSSILIGDQLDVQTFVTKFEQLQSRVIQDKSEDVATPDLKQLVHLGTEADCPELCKFSSNLFNEHKSELFEYTKSDEKKKGKRLRANASSQRSSAKVENAATSQPKKSVSWSNFVYQSGLTNSSIETKQAPLDIALTRIFCQFMNGVCSHSWESRHGAALGLNYLFTPLIKRCNMPSEKLIIVVDHLLKVFLLDNFCDFVSEETSFPVRETLAHISELVTINGNLLGSVVLVVKELLDQTEWHLRINGYLLLNSIVEQSMLNKNDKTNEKVIELEDLQQFCKLCLNNLDFDPDITRFRNQFFLNSFDLFEENAKNEVSTFILQSAKQSCHDEESSAINDTFVSDSTLELLHKINDNSDNSMTIFSEYAEIIKRCCWQRIFTKVLLSDEAREFSDIFRCLKTLSTVFDEQYLVCDCYLYALLCFSLNENSNSVFEAIQRNVSTIIVSIKCSSKVDLAAKIGALCTHLLQLLLLQPTSVIKLEASFCTLGLNNIKFEVPKLCSNVENLVHENVIQIIAGLITCQPDFAQIVDSFIALSDCQSYLNVKIGLEALLYYGSLGTQNLENFTGVEHILARINQIVSCKNWIFQENLEKFALIRKLVEKLRYQEICETKDMNITKIQEFVNGYDCSKNDEENEIVKNIKSRIESFHIRTQKYRISLQLLSATVLVKFSNLPEKLSPIINSLLTGLKSTINLNNCSLAAQALIDITESGKMSDKAIKVLCRNLTDFMSDHFSEDLKNLFNNSVFEKESGSNQNVLVAQNITKFFKENENSPIKYCVQVLLSNPVKKIAQEFLLEITEKQKNSIEMRTCVCFCFLFRYSNSKLDDQFVLEILDRLIREISESENEDLNQNLILKSLVIASGVLNPTFIYQFSQFLFEKMLTHDNSNQKCRKFAMHVILMIALRLSDPAEKLNESLIKPFLTISLISSVLKSIASYDITIRSIASHVFGFILHEAVNIVDKFTKTRREIKTEVDLPKCVVEAYTESSEFLLKLINNQAFAEPSLPVTVKAELRSYQKDGVSWLQFLRNYNLNGILADDLGLGKTLMCICILAEQMYDHIKSKKSTGPKRSLIVCPKSLIHHWVHEIKTFCPSLHVQCFEKRNDFAVQDNTYPYVVIITSYSIVRSDCDVISKQEYDYIILDEGHVIKNRLWKTFQTVMQLKGEHRLVLTGTPIQNSVCELWTLFEFLVPSYLGSIEQFKSCFANKLNTSKNIENSSNKSLERNSKALKQLHAKVLPLILRREKESVLKELPPKTMQDIICVMTENQQQLYDRTESKFKQACSEKISSFKLIKILLQICNNPEFLGTQFKFKSGKIEAFTELISNIFPEDAVNYHRVLVFFQTKAMLKVLSQLLRDNFQNLTFLTLDGSLTSIERMKVVKQFNSDPTFDLLLSTTSVGGVGLNLTGADTVVFVEHDFNPVKDLQAMDRTHRIGQTKHVTVYRLITKDSIEERIMNIQKFKTAIANSVINEENSSTASMHTSNLADAFTGGLLDDSIDDELTSKKRKKDKESLLEELEHLWEPLSKISDIM